VWRESFTVAGTLDNDLVTGISQAVQGAVAQDRVVKQSQPLFYCTVAGDDKARLAVSGDDQLIEVSRLLTGELLQTEIVQDKQVWADEGAKGLLQGMVDP